MSGAAVYRKGVMGRAGQVARVEPHHLRCRRGSREGRTGVALGQHAVVMVAKHKSQVSFPGISDPILHHIAFPYLEQILRGEIIQPIADLVGDKFTVDINRSSEIRFAKFIPVGHMILDFPDGVALPGGDSSAGSEGFFLSILRNLQAILFVPCPELVYQQLLSYPYIIVR
ncbi:MAG: hypothetical protein LHW45_02080 [Candidatus Cloacimonetes bacterium]|nr:hypothetical protein [Candidatus Cloacimonadota bacterium]MDY0366404.1 hypothetical protein [Candidatus Syntrophosphaera sp.]